MKQEYVYLAGGTHTDWRDLVKESCPNLIFLDPKEKERGSRTWHLEEYTTWDLHYIKRCDIFFAYMERTNPSGIGLSVELGYAHGIGKTVLLALEDKNEYTKDRYLQFLKKGADITYPTLEEAISFLKSFQE